MMENDMETNTSIQNKETVNNDVEKEDCGDERNESEEHDDDEERISDETSDEEMYECSCYRVFIDLEKYKKHKLKCKEYDSDFEVSDNESEDTERSNPCDQIYDKAMDLKKHNDACHPVSDNEADDTESSKYACNPCDQIYDNAIDLKKHNDACHPVISEEQPDSTRESERSGMPAEANNITQTITIGWINSKGNVIRDRTIIHKKITRCHECGNSLKGRTSYMVHKLKHENDKAGISYKCQRCQEVFKCEPDLQVHENAFHCAEHLPFKCHHCDEKFLTFVATDSHMLYTHNDDGGRFPFKCYECSDVFITNDLFYRHMISHSNEKSSKTIECKICKKKFYVEGGGYQRHVNTHTKYPCEICGKLFSRNAMPKHMRSHEEVKRYECSVCNKRFAQQTNQKNHMRVHSGIKPYECEICQKTYNHKVSLKTHKKRAHNIDWWEENGKKKPNNICEKTPIWKPLRK